MRNGDGHGCSSIPGEDCVVMGNEKNVMLNLVQHLIASKRCKTLKQVQGDKIGVTTQSRSKMELIR